MKSSLVPSSLLALSLLATPAASQGMPGAGPVLPQAGDPKRAAVDAASVKIGEMSRLLTVSREKPERAAKLWDGFVAEMSEAWQETLATSATKVTATRTSPVYDARGWRKPYETFLQEFSSGGRELLMFRQSTVQKTEGLQAAIDAFPARRTEWLSRMNDATNRVGLGEKALAEASPKAATVQDALDKVVVARNVAVNVSADTQALRDQVQRDFGQKAAMPTAVTNLLGRFGKATELYPGVPESWQRMMMDAGQGVRKAFEQNAAVRAKYDATYGVLVQQQLFEAVARFKGLAFKDLVLPPGKVEADLRVLLKKLGEKKVTPEDLEREKQRNATECKAFFDWLRSDREKTKHAAELASARACGPVDCRTVQLAAAEGPCSASSAREIRLQGAKLSSRRADRQAELRKRLELEIESGSKGFTPEKKKAVLDEIEALNEPGDEETALWRRAQEAEAGDSPECRKANAAATVRCDPASAECVSGSAPYDALVREMEAKEKEMWKLKADRDKRRKALGLPVDENWDDCPTR